jgi:hypothetical protein
VGALSYKQKRSVINHLADPGNWVRREIDLAWLEDPARRYKVTGMNGTTTTHIGPNHVVVSDAKMNGFLELKRVDQDIHARDETGKTVIFHRTGKYHHDNEGAGIGFSFFNEWPQFQKLDGRRADMHGVGLSLLFGNDSGKKLFFHDSGGIAEFPPTPEAMRPTSSSPLRSLFHRHVISFPAAFETPDGTSDAAKLVIAFDFAVEPGLRSMNTIKPYSTWKRDERGNVTVESMQQPWNDSVEFEGHYVAVPTHFSVAKTDNGFDVSTDRDYRDWVVGHAQIVQSIAEGDLVHPQRTNQMQLRFIDMQSGVLMVFENEERWRYSAYESPKAPRLARNMRAVLSDRMHLSGRDFVAVNYDENRTLVAVKEDELTRAHGAMEATQRVIDAIETGLPKGANALDFLRENFAAGADPKYYSSDASKSFADLMVKHGRRDLERALIELQGSHEFAVFIKPGKHDLM